jgi:hypothetical protein
MSENPVEIKSEMFSSFEAEVRAAYEEHKREVGPSKP